MRVTYDSLANAVYIYLTTSVGPSIETSAPVDLVPGGTVLVDISKAPKAVPVGIEVLGARSVFSEEFLSRCEQLENEGIEIEQVKEEGLGKPFLK